MIHFCDTFAFSHANERPENQDTCGYLVHEAADGNGDRKASVLFVADGVSNANGGQAAARIRKVIRRPMTQLLFDAIDLTDLPEATRDREIYEMLRDVITETDQALRPMGTYCATISIALVLGCYVYTANLGDSPIFLVTLDRDDLPVSLQEIYTCHNRAGEAVRAGWMTKEDALLDPLKNRLSTKVLGENPARDSIAMTKTGLEENNLLLLGSDGALSVLTEAELLDLIGENSESGLAEINRGLFQRIQKIETADDNYTLLAQWIRVS